MKTLIVIFALGGLVLFTGCAGSKSKPAKYVQIDSAPLKTPPSGKSLVCFHRPKAHASWGVKNDLWDGDVLMGVVGSGNSIAYVCEPGHHYFLNRSSDQVSAAQAILLGDQVYDFWINPGASITSTLKMKPVKPGSKERAQLPQLMTEQLWVKRDSNAAELERKDLEKVRKLFQEFVSGSRKKHLQQMGAEDHR